MILCGSDAGGNITGEYENINNSIAPFFEDMENCPFHEENALKAPLYTERTCTSLITTDGELGSDTSWKTALLRSTVVAA